MKEGICGRSADEKVKETQQRIFENVEIKPERQRKGTSRKAEFEICWK